MNLETLGHIVQMHNASVLQRHRDREMRTGQALREIGFTAHEMERYSGTVAGIGMRLNAVIRRKGLTVRHPR